MHIVRLVLVALLSACSVFTVSGPSPTTPTCTTSRASPALDTILAGATILGGLALAGRSENESDDDIDYGGEGHVAGEFSAVLLVSGVAAGLSAIYGFHETSACRATSHTP